jgi:AcrR family transcriptional regulator
MARDSLARKTVSPRRTVDHDRRSVRRILDAALTLWSRSGYAGTSLKEIAARAGVAKSLLHYHFESKEHLLIELQTHFFRKVAEQVTVAASSASSSPDGSVDRIADQVWNALVAMRDQVPLGVELFRESRTNATLRRHLNAFHREVAAVIRVGIDALSGGHLERHRAERLSALTNVAFEGFLMHLYATNDPEAIRPAYDELSRILRKEFLGQ